MPSEVAHLTIGMAWRMKNASAALLSPRDALTDISKAKP